MTLIHILSPSINQILNVYKILRPGERFMNVIPNRKGYDYRFVINAGHKHLILSEELKQVAERNGSNFLEVYSAPVPGFMNSWFTHAKYVNICQKIQFPSRKTKL